MEFCRCIQQRQVQAVLEGVLAGKFYTGNLYHVGDSDA